METTIGLIMTLALSIVVFVLHEAAHAVVARFYSVPLRRVRIGVPTLVRTQIRGTEICIGPLCFLISVAYDGDSVRRLGRVPGAILALSAPIAGTALPLLGLWVALCLGFRVPPAEGTSFLELMTRPQWWVVYFAAFGVVVNLCQLIPLPTSDLGQAASALFISHTNGGQRAVSAVCRWTNRTLFAVTTVMLLVFLATHVRY